jgi:glutamate synthase domain-containing protein 2
MTLSKPNSSAATFSKNRTKDDVSPFSGMCATCIEGCPGLCEIGLSSFRSTETIYPQPFGPITAASQKDYPIDFSHFNILGTAVGAQGLPADSDVAIFSNVDLTTSLGRNKEIKLKLPFVIPGIGSTDVAKKNWEGLAIGSAISGTILTIGENICGMDEQSIIQNGKVVKSPELERRVKLFKDWQTDGYGEIVVQANVEDTRIGAQEYAIRELGVTTVEIKWGQGAKNIGGEVKINSLEKAKMLKDRGYIVLPNPYDEFAQEAFKKGAFKEFERHSRLGMVSEEGFMQRVEELRQAGARNIFLKTGAYRPADLARAIKFSSMAKIDVLTIDGAGGGTGMSPWRMMNEWGIPTVELESLTYEYAERLKQNGQYVPDIVIAGGLTMEDHLYKALALGAPYVKAVGMARSPITAVMVGKTIENMINDNNISGPISKYGTTKEEIFMLCQELEAKFGSQFNSIPCSAIALYSYYQRLAQGLKQFMCGNRKFALEYIERNDLISLTREAEEVSGISYVTECDMEEVDQILGVHSIV